MCLQFLRPSSPSYEGHPFISEQICWFYRQCHWMWVSRFLPRSMQLPPAVRLLLCPASPTSVAVTRQWGWGKHPVQEDCGCSLCVQKFEFSSLINTCSLICGLCSFTRALKYLFFQHSCPVLSLFFEGEDLLPEGLSWIQTNRFSKGWILEQPLIGNFGSWRQQW